MAQTTVGNQVVHLRLTCVTPPSHTDDSGRAEFGLQDRTHMIHRGHAHADGSVSYEIPVPVARQGATNAVRFLGPYVHGTAAAPFLYLSVKRPQAGPEPWIRRLKIPLTGLTWDQVDATPGLSVFAARVSGNGSGTVPLLDGGWTRQDTRGS